MSDPKRLRDGAGGDDLRVLVRAAEADVLDDDAVARLRARLAAGAIGTTAVARAKPSLFRALASKIAAVVGAGAIAAVAIAAWPAHHVATPAAPAPISTHVEAAPIVTAPATTPIATDVPSISVMDLPRPAVRAEPVVHVQPPPTPAPVATSPREGLLLLRARHALPTDPASALSLVRQHESEFPASQLAPERDKIRAEAEAKGAR